MPMPLRVECTLEGYEDNWLEVSDLWLRRELMQYMQATGPAFIALWQQKVSGCYLRQASGVVITDPRRVHEQLDEMDVRLVRFINHAPLTATDHLLTLGEVSARLSSGASAAAKTPMTPTTRTPTPAPAE